MLGLKGSSTGLIQSATTKLGTATSGATAGTGLVGALEDGAVDYSYAASGDSKLTLALTAYETW